MVLNNWRNHGERERGKTGSRRGFEERGELVWSRGNEYRMGGKRWVKKKRKVEVEKRRQLGGD